MAGTVEYADRKAGQPPNKLHQGFMGGTAAPWVREVNVLAQEYCRAMVDVLTREQRHRVMSRIRSKDTRPEMLVRRCLYGMGYRYRLHAADLPGKPDIVFRGRRKVIFVNGCFWHSHTCANGQRKPKTNSAFWDEKRSRTADRDTRVATALERLGWDVFIIWECELTATKDWMEPICQFLGPASVASAKDIDP